ncbi:MAG: GldG family protein, partial [Clostridia bacterium]|nr:GldG family protein [Clostridia bacterium]
MKENEKKKTENVKEIFSRIQENLKNKWLLKISTTIILIAVILGCYFVLTMLMKDKWTLPEIDLTKNKIYSLSEETENKIKNIDKDIEITLVNFSNNDTVLNFADKYKNLNKKIKVEIVDDLTSRPDLVQKYSLTDGGGLILVASGENEKAIHDHDLYTYDYSTYETIDLTEEAITNAIVNVTADVKPKVYFMSNHLMYDIDYYNKIIQYMEDEANEVETIDIFARENIPEDCKCFVITTLKEDITEKEKDELLNYINNGGKLLLMCGPNLNGATLTNFQKVLDEYGITIENGVLFEGNNDNMLTGYPDLIVENINTTNIFKGTNSKVCLIDSANLKYDDSKSEEIGVEYNVLAETSEKAFIR